MYGPRIIELREAGYSYNKIVSELGCSKATVSYHCSKVAGHTPNAHQGYVTSDDNLETLERLLRMGVRKVDIAEALDLPYSYVLRIGEPLKCLDVRAGMSNYDKVRLRRRHLKALAVVYKGGECINCGYRRCVGALDFHHIDPASKDFTISQIANRSWKSLKLEIDKCVLLCANCHRELHDRYFQDSADPHE